MGFFAVESSIPPDDILTKNALIVGHRSAT
jgi:hypothetical protein